VRVELAKCKPTTYDLPGAGHTFGKALERDSEDAGAGPSAPPSAARRAPGRLADRARALPAVTMSWKTHVKNPHKVRRAFPRAVARASGGNGSR